jgi:hypothetical protein
MDEQIPEEDEEMSENQVGTFRRIALMLLLVAVVGVYVALTIATIVR